ncbi:MAG: flavin reductase family protein [Thermodesulfobacteriota bacterium]
MPDVDVRVFRDLSYGLYIITSRDGEKINGQLVNTVIQVTSEPPRVAVVINKKNLTHDYIEHSGVFAAMVLDENVSMVFLGPFGFRTGRDVDKFEKVAFRPGATGCPIVTENTLAMIEASVINHIDIGTHTIFVGDVVNSEVLQEGTPLTYRYYHEHLRGKTPPNAPGYVRPS